MHAYYKNNRIFKFFETKTHRYIELIVVKCELVHIIFDIVEKKTMIHCCFKLCLYVV